MDEYYNPSPIFYVVYVDLMSAINEKNWEKVKDIAEQLKKISGKDQRLIMYPYIFIGIVLFLTSFTLYFYICILYENKDLWKKVRVLLCYKKNKKK